MLAHTFTIWRAYQSGALSLRQCLSRSEGWLSQHQADADEIAWEMHFCLHILLVDEEALRSVEIGGMKMSKFDYRDERVREEMIGSIADQAWGAIKDWQNASDDRPKLSAAQIREATDDFLFDRKSANDCETLGNEGVVHLLKFFDREGAAIYLK